MGFIEEERKRRENLERENALDTPARREERERLEREGRELRRGELLAKSRAYFRESFTPKLVDELSAVVKGKVSLSEHGGFSSNLRQTFDILEKGEIWLRLDWDQKRVHESTGDHLWGNLKSRFREIEIDYGADDYFISKSIGIVFSPSGSIRFGNWGKSKSSEITYEEWKDKKSIEEASLERAFKNPGEYLIQVKRPYSEGSPTDEKAGPGL